MVTFESPLNAFARKDSDIAEGLVFQRHALLAGVYSMDGWLAWRSYESGSPCPLHPRHRGSM